MYILVTVYMSYICVFEYVYIYITYSKIWPRFQHYDPKGQGCLTLSGMSFTIGNGHKFPLT